MIRTASVILILSMLPTYLLANTTIDPSKLLSLVELTPKFLAAQKEFAYAKTQIVRAGKTQEPTIDFSLLGDYPLISGSDNTTSRSSTSDNFYVDGLAKLNVPLYDFGETENRVEAKKLRADLAEIELKLVQESLVFDAVKFGVEVLKKRESLALIAKKNDYLNAQMKVAEERFKAGTGTLTDIKKIALDLIDLGGEKQRDSFEKDRAERDFFETFGEPIDLYLDVLADTIPTEGAHNLELDLSNLKQIQKFTIEIRSLDREISAIRLSKKPKVNGSITSRFFDINKARISDYEVFGGINLSMPIFDAGIRDLETDSLEIKKEILFQEKRVTEREIKIKLQTLSKRAQTLENEISDNQKKIDATRKLLNDTEYRAELLGEDFYKIISQTLELRRLFKSKSDLEWDMRFLASESLFVTERLVPAITLPTPNSSGAQSQ